MSLRHRALQSAPFVGFGLGILFLALSLAGYDPSDPPGHGAEPLHEHPLNPCGPVGAALAHALFTSIGWASWLFPPALAVVNLLLFRRRVPEDRTGPSLGFALVLAVTAAAIHRLTPTLWPSPPVGSGGYVGALVAVFLERTFGTAGLILILSSVGLFGLALCHEVLIGWPAAEARAWFRRRLVDVVPGRMLALPDPSGGVLRVASGDWDVVIDVQGGFQVRTKIPDALLVFIQVPDLDVLEARLRARGTDSPETIERRLANARRELELASRYDVHVLNDDLDRAVEQLAAILTQNGCGAL